MNDPQSRLGWPAISLFLILVVAISAPLDLLLIRSGRIDIGRGFPIHLGMWAPGIAALIACRIRGIDLGFLGLSRFPGRKVLRGYLLVLGYAICAFAVLWITGLAPLDWAAFTTAAAKLYDGSAWAPVMAVLFTLSFGVVQSSASALGEEIGWRGFLLPALCSRLGVKSALLVSGLIWAVWHFPLIVFSDYSGAAPLPFQLFCFTVMIVSTGTIYGLLRLRSASVWPAVVMHAVHNAAIQWLLDPMTDETGRGAWYAGEFGIGLAIVTAVLAIAMLVRAPALNDAAGDATG